MFAIREHLANTDGRLRRYWSGTGSSLAATIIDFGPLRIDPGNEFDRVRLDNGKGYFRLLASLMRLARDYPFSGERRFSECVFLFFLSLSAVAGK
jgi:hypothetical protein